MHMNWAKAANVAGQDISQYMINDAERTNENARMQQRDINRAELDAQRMRESHQLDQDADLAREQRAVDDRVNSLIYADSLNNYEVDPSITKLAIHNGGKVDSVVEKQAKNMGVPTGTIPDAMSSVSKAAEKAILSVNPELSNDPVAFKRAKQNAGWGYLAKRGMKQDQADKLAAELAKEERSDKRHRSMREEDARYNDTREAAKYERDQKRQANEEKDLGVTPEEKKHKRGYALPEPKNPTYMPGTQTGAGVYDADIADADIQLATTPPEKLDAPVVVGSRPLPDDRGWYNPMKYITSGPTEDITTTPRQQLEARKNNVSLSKNEYIKNQQVASPRSKIPAGARSINKGAYYELNGKIYETGTNKPYTGK